MFSDSIDTIKISLIDRRFDGHGNGNDSWNKTAGQKASTGRRRRSHDL